MNYFDRISLKDWRQFSSVDLDLSRQVTVITGQNGCGKTTLLNVLGKHFGWNTSFVSTPFMGKKKARRFWSDVKRARQLDFDDENPVATTVGSITYDNGSSCSLQANTITASQYQLTYQGQQPVVGLHIPSHRPPATYHNIQNIPTSPITAEQHYQQFQQLLLQTYGSSNRTENPGIAQKRSLISLALFGYGNEAMQGNTEYQELFEGFQKVLSQVLPKSIGFKKLEVRMPEVVMITKTGEFSLDAMSGGVNALFGTAWQIHMFGAKSKKLTVTIDEPENHLHPSMQRSLLPSLAKAFPGYRFIVATHSPFIVSSSPDASVYGLAFDEDGRVQSHLLDAKELSGTPNQILKEVLDVSSNLPLWVEEKIISIVHGATQDDPRERARRIMAELRELGLADAIAELPWEDGRAED